MSGADSIILGNVSFGPAQTLWEEQPSLRELYEQACQGLVRAECEVEELRARVAVLEEERRIIVRERDEAREMAEELLQKNAKQAVEIVRLKEAQ